MKERAAVDRATQRFSQLITPSVFREVKALHRQAMQFVEQAILAKSTAQTVEAQSYLEQAYSLAVRAADAISNYDAEPTRSVLQRSAATLALDCGRPKEAAILARRGLRGHPPAEIALELNEVLERVPTDIVLSLPSDDEASIGFELIDDIVEQGRFGREHVARKRGRDMVKEFVAQVLEGEMKLSRDADATINTRIAQIDHLLSLQLNAILHHPAFQKLEASWRGIKYMMDQSETSSMLKIRVLNVSKKELLRDFQRAPEFDQTVMFKKVYQDAFGIFGGEPFGALVGDYEFSKHSEDIELLEKVSQMAAVAHAPFLTAAAPDLLNLNSFSQMAEPYDIGKIFDRTEFAKWKSFRASEDSRYVGLTMPRVLMRLPCGKDTKPVDDFSYEEGVDGTDHSKYLWGNAAYALGARLAQAFAQYGWCVSIRGVEGGGLVQGLPTHTFHTDEGDVARKCPTEIAFTDRREKDLADEGLIPLVHCKGTDYAAFFSVPSANKPKYDKAGANNNARLSVQLPYILAVSRFAHHLKSITRDKVGGFKSREECQTFLNNWIMQFVNAADEITPTDRAKYPLRDARIEVGEIPGRSGAYRAIAFLQPQFQLGELTVPMRLVIDLPSTGE